MYSAAFIYEPKDYDDDFHRLNILIKEVAQSLSGYIGNESWQSSDGKKINAIYYWRDLKSLNEFASHPKHLEAKRQYTRWYRGYHIVISEVMRSYGDGALSHTTPNERHKNF